MAAGDLVVADFQLELRTTLMGDTTIYALEHRRGGISGLLDEAVKQPESEFAHADGSFAGDGYARARNAQIAFVIRGGDAATTGAGISTMRTVWAPSTTDLDLYFQVPGFSKSYVSGRPMGIVTSYDKDPRANAVSVLARFRITDPTIYTA